MVRMLGFVVGSLTVFGGLLYLLSPAPIDRVVSEFAERPDRVTAEPPAAAAAFDTVTIAPIEEMQSQPAVIETRAEPAPVFSTAPLAERTDVDDRPVASAATGTGPATVTVSESEPGSPTEPHQALPSGPATPIEPGSAPAAMPGTAPLADDELALVEQSLAQMAIDDGSPLQWFAVWHPFHSEYSAQAFADKLAQMTGLDYRVVRSEPTLYEVAMGFNDDEERIANIALIEETTGLRIAGGSL
ncbi:MAG: hypothetical protein KJO55_03540 [Gammaproteobacteria bacterium]|nr:hypothetical protein [Gammaproteobacteria bacterium]